LSFVQLSDQPLFQNSFILSFLKTMPSLSFQKPFVPGIRAMLDKDYATRLKIKPKTTTIRATRKRPFKKGDKLFLFSGLRTKYCHKLGEVICLKTEDVEISEFIGNHILAPAITFKLDGSILAKHQILIVAVGDGFETIEDMITWFRKNHGFPFTGQRIHMDNTYDRKYYLHKKTKDLNIKVRLTKLEKTIEITTDQVETVRKSKHITELARKYQYGVQIINPLFK